MQPQLTAVIKKVPRGFIGYVKELPGANSQGATMDEARRNLQEAVELITETNMNMLDDGKLTDQEKSLIDERLDECECNPGAFIPWQVAKARITTTLKKRGSL